MIDNIWSGWRSSYVSNLPSRISDGPSRPATVDPSIFRQILDSGLSDDEAFIVHRGATVFTIMNAYPYAVGHLLVLPYRQVAELEDLTAEESIEMWATVETAIRILRGVLRPDGFNVGLNLGPAAGGSVNEHIHVHVVPRWFGDSNFMVTSASTKAIPEALDVTCERLRTAWNAGKNDAGKNVVSANGGDAK